MSRRLTLSICIPAYNEEANIEKNVKALLNQKIESFRLNKIVVVSSGSTDKTNSIVQKLSEENPQVELIIEEKRMGKSHAINTFLRRFVTEDIIVLESADTVPLPHTIEQLCLPFVRDSLIGMTGGAPIPLNDPNTFIGYIVHTWWWFHRNIPRFGEIIAFRNVLREISETTAVDEAYIQAKMIQRGYKVVHVDAAIVRNKGPENFRDLLIQRRRIFNGHSRLYQEQRIKIDNMTRSSLYLLLFRHKMYSLKELLWTVLGILIEIYARFLGMYDQKIKKKNPFIWERANSTKDLSFRFDV